MSPDGTMSSEGYDSYPPPPPLRRTPPPGPAWRSFLPLAFVVFALVLIVRAWFGGPTQLFDANAVPRTVVARGDLADDERATIDLFKAASHSVVFITTSTVTQSPYTFNVMEQPQGSGSGFIWDDQGYIVTNGHVLEGAQRVQVTLSDQSTWKARVVGVALDNDLAVLKIDAPSSKLQAVSLGTSSDLEVGQKVLAIGNPFGLDQTLTTGIISGLGRQIRAQSGRTISGVIQTDAAINPGNSGGPLLDSAGRMIGVNTAIMSPSGVSAGIGFAIPVDTVNRVVPSLVSKGQVERAGLGIHIGPDQWMRRLGYEGVLVLGVEPGSAAEKAGLVSTTRNEDGNIHLGDIILQVAGKKTRNANDLLDALANFGVGDTVEIQVLRKANTDQETRETLTIALQALP